MDTTLTLTSPAKLNLFLHINGRLANGYHELQTVFQILDRGDVMNFETRPVADISVSPNFGAIPLNENLAYRAAKLLQEHSGTKLGAHIHLHKYLPTGGGVGGGSSNAATTLIALNKLWQLGLSQAQLADLGLQLGADVPVFVHGKTAWAEGVGEQLTPMDLGEHWYVILSPNCHVSTAQVFSHQRLTRDSPKLKIAPALGVLDIEEFNNDCQAIVTELYPEIGRAISWLDQFGSGRLTGTGACCFCRVESETKAQQVLNEASSEFKGFIAKGVNLSPAIQRQNEAD